MNDFAGSKSTDKIKKIYTESIGDTHAELILGSNTSKIMESDPKLLLFTLSRHKFVSKMFSGFDKVLEIGCQEGFGSSIVSKEVKQLYALDFYKPYIESCKRRINVENIKFSSHDMLDGPIPENFNGVFALDVLEHIEKSHEDAFMKNIVKSLHPHGTLIIGMPSTESQKYASEASKIGHVNCKEGKELNEFCKKYFHNVYSFSMNDEVLHTGFFPMSQYIFTLSSSLKNN